MIKCKSIQKFKDKQGRIVGYRLVDKNNKNLDVKSSDLKKAIANKQVDVVNLTLTSDGRLIDRQSKIEKPVQKEQSSQKIDIDSLINRARALGASVIGDKKNIIMIRLDMGSIKNLTVIIQDSVKKAPELAGYNGYAIKVIGGKGLESTHDMFKNCKAQIIDLSNFDTSNVTDMGDMFEECTVQTIDLSTFNTSNVKDMGGMFEECTVQTLDLSNFDTSNVWDMRNMFFECRAQTIDLSNFDTSKVTNMGCMFGGCQAKTINLSNFDTSKVTNMEGMFKWCKAESLDLSNFDTSSVVCMSYMFDNCNAEVKTNDSRLQNMV